jgi:uncharacterized membrane protein YedE/YeeE
MTVSGYLTALASGLLFGLGLAVSHMVDPAKVLGFLDVAGNWDPSLAFVMGGALLVTLVAFPRVLRRARPLDSQEFAVSSVRQVERHLVVGAALFGVGWGLVGLCPGPAVASLAFGKIESVVFLIAMIVGFALANAFPSLPSGETSRADA